MNILIILSVFALVNIFLVFFGLKNFHKDNFQFLATIPTKNNGNGEYKGINLTYYGLISSYAYSSAIFLFLSLMKYINYPNDGIYLIIAIILIIGIPSSKILAYLIENRKNTLTIGGASFLCGILSLPITYSVTKFFMVETIDFLLPALSALSISYTYGEGIGRLACLSFGCCYGKPAKMSLNKAIQMFLTTQFNSQTKKAVYDSNYAGIRLINTQGIITLTYSILSFLSIVLFLSQNFKLALLLTLPLSQLLRFFNEFLRDDFRGNKKITIYQLFSLLLAIYGLFLIIFLKEPEIMPFVPLITYNIFDLTLVIICFIITFLYTGLSKVTASNIKFYVKDY